MHKHKRKIVSLFVIACMLFSNTFSTFATNQDIQNIPVDNNKESASESNEKENSSNSLDNVNAGIQENSLQDDKQDKADDNNKVSEKDNKNLPKEENKDVSSKSASNDNEETPKKDNQEITKEDNKQEESLLDIKDSSSIITKEDKAKIINDLLDNKITDILSNENISTPLGSEQLYADKISIEGIQLGTAGDDLQRAESLDIRLFNKSQDSLHNITRQIYKVIIDDLEVPMYDEKDNLRTFVLWNTNLLSLFDKSYNGKKAIEDFKLRNEHKVVIQFFDGSIAPYSDSGYTIPDGRGDQTPSNPDTPKDGVAKEYEIKKVEIVDNYGIEFQVEFNKDIQKHHVEEIKAIKVNGHLFEPKPSDMRAHWSGKLISADEDLIKKAKEKSPIELDIIFKDGSILKNYTVPAIENPHGPRVVKTYILNETKTKTSVLDKFLVRDVKVNPTDRFVGPFQAHEVILEFNPINIDGIDVNIKKLTYVRVMGGNKDAEKINSQENKYTFDIPQIVVWPKTSLQDTDLEFILELDKTVPSYKNKNIAIKLDWNGDFVAPEVESGNDTPPTPPAPNTNIASEYKISDMLFEAKKGENDKDKFVIKFDKILKTEHFDEIENIKINETVFEKSAFSKYEENGIYTDNETILNKIKEKSLVNLEIKFKDSSKLNKSKYVLLPNSNIAAEYEIKEFKIEKGFLRDKFEILFNKKIDKNHVALIESIKINDRVFEKDKYEFFGSFDGGIQSDNKEVLDKVKSSDIIKIEIKFKDSSILKFSNEDTKPKPPTIPQPPKTGIAAKYDIVNVETGTYIDVNDNSKEVLNITFDKSVLSFHYQYIKKISINGLEFDWKLASPLIQNNDTLFRISTKEMVEKAKEKSPIEISITFADDSILTKNIAYIPKELTLDSPLKNGSYTLNFKAYQKNTNMQELSTLNNYFDIRVKLEVENGVKKVSFLNHAFADLILDLAIENNGQFRSFTKKTLKESTNGSIKLAEYTMDMPELKGVKNFLVLGSGPMGGNSGDIGNYDSPNYKKIDIVFDNIVSEGWTNYKIIEDEEKKKEKNNENLIQGLIANGLDTNKDNQISKEELKNAKGVRKKSSIQIDGFPSNNVLDLERLELTDISMLKDLGPHIKGINLDGNNIESLPADVFENATGVTHILLGGNEVKSIDKDTFKNLKNLYFIDFDSNPLGTLPQGVFDNNPKLSVLSLMNTALTSVPDDLIKKNTRLEYIYLIDNKLNNLPDDFFSENIYLREALLFNNNLESIPSSLGINKNLLTTIQAQNNKIQSIPETFTNLKAIKKLDFSNNKLSSIPDELFVNLIKLSNHSSINIDLTSNNLSYIPIDKMIDALSNGKKLGNIEVNLNNLPSELSDVDKQKFEKIGIYFGSNSGQDAYYPQKSSIKAQVQAENGKISLNQKFDVLELFYWDLGDSTYYGGKNVFESEKEFYDYLIGEGRDNNKVSRNLERDEAIKDILINKTIKWKVNTLITKNNSTTVYSDEKENKKEGQTQTFDDPSMKLGDEYKLTKTLYAYHVNWIPVIEYSVNFTAGETNIKDKFEEVSVKLNKSGQDSPSMAAGTLNPKAHLVEKNGKFQYTVFFKPMQLSGISAEISKFFITKDGKEVEIQAKDESGEYPKSYTFELDEKVDRLPVLFEIAVMGGRKIPADLVFVYGNTTPKPNQDTVKGHILTSDSTQISMADRALDRNIEFKKIDKKAGPFSLVEFTIKFNEMKIGDVTGGVESLSVKLKDTWMDAKPVNGKKGVFTFEMLESAVKPKGSEKDTILNIKFGTYPKIPGHEMEREAKLLLDWNEDFNGIVPQPNPNPDPNQPNPPINPNPDTQDVYNVDVMLNRADSNEKSVANNALVNIAKVEKQGENYRYTIEFKPMVILGRKGNITKFAIINNGNKQYLQEIQENENKKYTFMLDKKVDKLRVFVHADIMQEMGMTEQQADLIFKWNSPKKETIDAQLKINNNLVTAQIDDTVAKEKIESLKNDGVLQIDIKPEMAKIDELEIKANLSNNILEKITDVGNKSIELNTPISTVQLNKEVLSQLSKDKKNIQISVKRVENTVSLNLQGKLKEITKNKPIIEIEIKDEDGKIISKFNSNIKLIIPYMKNDNEESSKIKAYYIQDNSTIKQLESHYDENMNAVILETDHFSKFAIGYEVATTTPNNPGNNGPGGPGGPGGGNPGKQEMRDGIHYVNVWLKQANSNDLSMANKALSNQAKVVKNGNSYTYTLVFKPIDILGKTGNITKFSISKNGSKTPVYGTDGEYTFELNEKVDELLVYFEADIMKELGMGEKDAIVVFDWNGSNPAPSHSQKIEKDLKVKAIKIDNSEESIINKALNPKAKLVEEAGKYQYTIEFKKINIENKVGDIESFGIDISDYETKIITPISINDSAYLKSYSFILDEEKDKIKVSFKISGIDTKEKEAYLVFEDDKEKETKKEIKKVDDLKTKAQKVLSKDQSKYYKKDTLKAIEKALELYNKGDEKSKTKLETLLETARIEKVTYILKDGYMVGYPNNKFMPNNNITIAEAAVLFNQLIDDEVEKIEKPTIATKTWYSDAVNKLVALGYIKVEKNKKLDPQRPITRAEYAYIVAKLRNYPPTKQNLKDIDKDYWAAKEISSLVGKGIINGYKDKTFRPENSITRAEAVTIINNAFPINKDISKKAKFSDVGEKHWAYKAIMLASKN